ncbi:hypothetical protein Glove_485g27 [Diversispora epigaea]|uniref:Uncharacterized protein n=1 Tax=Diversispora epigaea TaxID=1348612 RepID=A0A397GSL4_9GLOM|nr:hypothetical protein Glove_485g27 [Diversispora epigaea]
MGTIAGIHSWNEFIWIYDGEEAGYIYARPLLKFGELNKFSPSKIQKIVKNRTITQPNPIISTHSNPPKPLTIPRINYQDTSDENLDDLVDELEHMVVDTTNEEEIAEKHENWKVFISGWALQQNQKIREPVKRIPTHIKYLLETMFHVGTANPRKKMTAAEMRSELIQRIQEGEIEEKDIPKESTIANWITSFSRGWKHAMALQVIKAAEHTLKIWKVFISGWALQQNQKIREPVKRIPTHIKYLLETMFHVGTANPRKKMTAAEMRSELIQRIQEGEIEEKDIPKESTIANWITSFSRGWKHAMALQVIKAAEHTLKIEVSTSATAELTRPVSRTTSRQASKTTSRQASPQLRQESPQL